MTWNYCIFNPSDLFVVSQEGLGDLTMAQDGMTHDSNQEELQLATALLQELLFKTLWKGGQWECKNQGIISEHQYAFAPAPPYGQMTFQEDEGLQCRGMFFQERL